MNRLSIKTIGIEKLKGHFSNDAYLFLHGCNTGFILAPFLSKLHSDGEFYLTAKGFSPNSDWAHRNKNSYNFETSCRYGKCLRLKPDNHPYIGYWGEY